MPPVDHRPRTLNVYRFEIEATWGGLPVEDQRLRDIEQMLSLLLVEGHGFDTARTDTSRLLKPTTPVERAFATYQRARLAVGLAVVPQV